MNADDPRRGQAALVSVVLPAYNVARFVAQAVDSIHAQTWPSIELIAVNDGSSDETGPLLDKLALGWHGEGRVMRVVHQANQGAAEARNRALAEASGEYVALFDADDVYDPELIRRQVGLLESDPELDLAFAMYRYVDEEGGVLSSQPPPATPRLGSRDLLADNVVHAPLFRSEILPDTGGLDATLRAHIDLDFFLRVTERRENSIGVIPVALSDYRRHGNQITGDWRRMRENFRRVFAKSVANGMKLTAREKRRIFSRVRLYWATLAYQAGEYPAARRLVLSSAFADPFELAKDPHGRVRLAACMASLLPSGLHERLQGWFNGRSRI